MSCNCEQHEYPSGVLQALLSSNGEPASITSQSADEAITVNGQLGILLNKSETECFKSPVPIKNYPINSDSNPYVINKKPNDIACNRKVYIKYLQPINAPTPPPITINQAPNILCPPAPSVIIRKPACEPKTPPPLKVREVPPQVPRPPSRKIVTIPGKLLPPPPRKLIIEKLPEHPDKPQEIHIERWLPFKDIKRKIKLNPKKADPKQCKPKNIIVNWSIIPCCEIKQDIKDLGVEQCDPDEYKKVYGEQLIAADELPEIANKVDEKHAKPLAANQDSYKYFNTLEGDLHALRIIENELGLDNEGLSEFKHMLDYLDSQAEEQVKEALSKKVHICENGICRLVSQISIENNVNTKNDEEDDDEEEEEEEDDSKEDEEEEDEDEEQSGEEEKTEFTVESTSYDIDVSTSSTSD
jgi:hypothetical protein